ncbi:hypothetical protein LOZ58_004216 [Ophidiomyces ophidiicola]|nr:hypothetical protein LOZ58_004216 [Ophidiomyces ophidiicola]
MLFASSLLLTSVAAVAHALSFGAAVHQENGVGALMRRSTQCKDVAQPSCESSCGEGYKTCVKQNMCFNPSRGETCCENGTFCSKGTYCADGGCCPNNMKLEECKAARTYTVISQTPTPSAEPTTVLTTRVTRTSTLVLTNTVVIPPSSPTPPSNTTVIHSTGTGTGTGTSWPRPTGGWNATMTTPGMPPQQTTNTAARVQGAAAALGLSVVVALSGML